MSEIARAFVRHYKGNPGVVAMQERANRLGSSQLRNTDHYYFVNQVTSLVSQFRYKCLGEQTAVRMSHDGNFAGARGISKSTECLLDIRRARGAVVIDGAVRLLCSTGENIGYRQAPVVCDSRIVLYHSVGPLLRKIA